MIEEAGRLYEARDYEAAQIELLKVLDVAPGQPAALRQLALMCAEQGRWTIAAPVLIQAIKANPDDLELRRWLGTLYAASDRFEDACVEADYILEREPANTEAILILVEALRQPQEFMELTNRIAELRKRTGDQAAFHLGMANALFRNGSLTEAENEARQALELDPASGVGQIILGRIFAGQDRREESEAAYAKAFDLLPETSLRRIQWPVYLLDNGRTEEGFQLLQELNGKNPGAVWILVPLARSALELGKLDEAGQWIDEAVKLDVRNIEARTLRARIDLAEGDAETGVEILKGLVREQPNSVQLNYQLALGYIAAGDARGAVMTLERVLELNPQTVPPAFMLVELYLRERDFISAQTLLNRLKQRLPEDRRVLSLQAETFLQEGRPANAAGIYRNLLAKSPDDATSAFRLGQVLLLQGNREEARAMFETVVARTPNFLPAITYLADLDVRNSDAAAAVTRFEALAGQHPESAATRFLLGQAHLANRDAESAEQDFKEVIRLTPNQPHGYLALARLYRYQTNRLEDAREQLLTLHRQSTENPQALVMLATLDIVGGDFEGAGNYYEELLKIQPDNLLALNNLASLYATRLSDTERALKLARKARSLAPRDPLIADTYGWVLLQQGDYRGALQLLREAAADLPANAGVQYHLGMACYLNGMENEARKSFESAAELEGDETRRQQVEVCLQMLAVQPGDARPETLAFLKDALQNRPTDPIALQRLAEIYESQGQVSQASELYLRAHQANSNSLPVLIGLARAYSLDPDTTSNAMQLARTARKLAPQDPEVAYALGKLVFRSGDYHWALSLLEESVSRYPDDPEVLEELARAYYSLGRVSETQRTLARINKVAGASAGDSIGTFEKLIALQTNLGDASTARSFAEKTLENEPDNVPAKMVLGLAAESLKDYALAGRSYQSVLQVYPEFIPAMKRLSILAGDHLGDDKLAYEYGLKAREILSSDSELAGSLGKVMYRRGDYSYAAQLLQEGIAQNPEAADELFYLGLCQVKQGMTNAGNKTLSEALKLDPNNPMAAEATKSLNP